MKTTLYTVAVAMLAISFVPNKVLAIVCPEGYICIKIQSKAETKVENIGLTEHELTIQSVLRQRAIIQSDIVNRGINNERLCEYNNLSSQLSVLYQNQDISTAFKAKCNNGQE